MIRIVPIKSIYIPQLKKIADAEFGNNYISISEFKKYVDQKKRFGGAAIIKNEVVSFTCFGL